MINACNGLLKLFEPDDYASLSKEDLVILKYLRQKCQDTFSHLCSSFYMPKGLSLKVGIMLQTDDSLCTATTYSDPKTGESEIYFSLSYIRAFPGRALNTTAPHEAAHAFCDHFDYKEADESHHGKLWQEAMKFIGLDPREVCFNMTEAEEATLWKHENVVRSIYQ